MPQRICIPTSKLVNLTINHMLDRYWQCARCPQKYPKSHGTKNPGMHLARAHSIHEEQSAKFKRLKQAQHSIQISMGEAAVRETRRARGSQRNIPRFPPHVAELSGTLYVSDLDHFFPSSVHWPSGFAGQTRVMVPWVGLGRVRPFRPIGELSLDLIRLLSHPMCLRQYR